MLQSTLLEEKEPFITKFFSSRDKKMQKNIKIIQNIPIERLYTDSYKCVVIDSRDNLSRNIFFVE